MQKIIDHLKLVAREDGNLTRAEAYSLLGIVEELQQERDHYVAAMMTLREIHNPDKTHEYNLTWATIEKALKAVKK
mgnify:CR=1 FL=1